MRHSWGLMGRHRGGRGFQGFRPGGHGDFGHRGLLRGRKIGSDDLQLLLLLLLSERPSHGYELIRALEQRSAGFYAPSPGMVYPALTYLEELFYATVTTDGARKLYELAPAGRAYLSLHRSAADAVMAQLEQFGRSMHAFSSGGSALSDRAPPLAPRRLVLGSRVDAVLSRLRSEAEFNRPAHGGPRHSGIADPFQYAGYGFSISPEQGELIYLLCRTLRARRVVEFATSVGVSALYLACALRDTGGGIVIGSEIVPKKIEAARRNLEAAGLDSWVELRTGDARETLRDLGAPVDFALIDGWPTDAGPSLAWQVVQIVAPQIRSGGMLMNDNAEADYLSYVRDPENGFVSITLPLKAGTELSLKL
jgi:predicted O-methyltransferase YrrM/DNA-binding PadR family transcriptional regulator